MTQKKNTVQRMAYAVWLGCAYAVVLCLSLTAPSAEAQVLYGTLSGTVTDAAKAAVPNAPVTVTDQGTGATRQTTTNAPLPVTQAVGGIYAQQSNIGTFNRDVFAVIPEVGVNLAYQVWPV